MTTITSGKQVQDAKVFCACNECSRGGNPCSKPVIEGESLCRDCKDHQKLTW